MTGDGATNTLVGGAGNDIIDGGAGNDALDGGVGNDTIIYNSTDTIANVKGGAGVDTLDASAQSGNLTINLTTQYTDFENFMGGAGNAALTGNALANELYSQSGPGSGGRYLGSHYPG